MRSDPLRPTDRPTDFSSTCSLCPSSMTAAAVSPLTLKIQFFTILFLFSILISLLSILECNADIVKKNMKLMLFDLCLVDLFSRQKSIWHRLYDYWMVLLVTLSKIVVPVIEKLALGLDKSQ